MKTTTTLLVAAALAGLCMTPASAAILVSEDFNYTAGHTVSADTLNGGTGFSGAWVANTTANGGRTVSDNELGTGTGNSMFINPTSGTTTAARRLSDTFTNLRGASTELWFSFDAEHGNNGTRVFGLSFLSAFVGEGDEGDERLILGKRNNDAVSEQDWQLFVGGGANSGSGVKTADGAVKLLLKMDFDTSTLSSWVLLFPARGAITATGSRRSPRPRTAPCWRSAKPGKIRSPTPATSIWSCAGPPMAGPPGGL